MEPIAPFELNELERDWIAELPGTDFAERVRENIEFLRPSTDGDERVVIPEEDPIEFAGMFLAAVWLGLPLALANPNWREQEQTEFDALIAENNFDAGSILIPTGGTTGGVKLAIHNWASLSAAARGAQDFLGGGPVDSCCVLPLYHVSGLMQLVRSFLSGGTIRFDEEEVAGACLSYVPTQLQRALQDEQCIQNLATARVIFVGGAGMPANLSAEARRLKLPVVPVYGMTETAAMVAAIPNEDFLNDSEAGAVPLGGARFSIDDDGGIRVSTPALFKGYAGQSSGDFSAGYRTGDAGWLDASGRLHVSGRMDRLINTGGEKVDPNEVEAALLQIEGIDKVRVFGEPDPEWGQIVVADYTSAAGSLLPDWKAQLKATLAPHKIPKKLNRVDAMTFGAGATFTNM